MTLAGTELERIRKGFGMSRVEFARELGLTGNHSGAYKAMTFLESNKRPISMPMAKLAWLLSTLPDLPDWPEHLRVRSDETITDP
jgi:hypothetical protein